MKRIEIIIPQEHLNELNDLLHKHKVGGMSFFDIKGRGKSKQMPVAVGRGVMYYIPEFGYRTKVDVVVPDTLVKLIVDNVLDKFGTGASAIGKIFVYDVATAYDIGTKEEGDKAL